MILHVTAGSRPVEVYVHGEPGAAEHLSVVPAAAVEAAAVPAPTDGSQRWLIAMVALVAAVSGAAGYRLGATPSAGQHRDAAYRSDDLPPPQRLPADGAAYPSAVPQAAEVPASVARALAQPPVVTPPPAPALPAGQPLAAGPNPRNPFGLE